MEDMLYSWEMKIFPSQRYMKDSTVYFTMLQRNASFIKLLDYQVEIFIVRSCIGCISWVIFKYVLFEIEVLRRHGIHSGKQSYACSI